MPMLNMDLLMLHMTPQLNVIQAIINKNIHTISTSRHTIRHPNPIHNRNSQTGTPKKYPLEPPLPNDWIKDTGTGQTLLRP